MKILIVLSLIYNVYSCGITNHQVIANRAWLQDTSDQWQEIITNHQEAFQGGVAFPIGGLLREINFIKLQKLLIGHRLFEHLPIIFIVNILLPILPPPSN